AGLLGGGAVHTEPDRDTRVEQRAGAADARAEPGVGGRAVRAAGAGPGDPGDRLSVQMRPARQPAVGTEPADRVHVLRRRAAEALEAVVVLVSGLGEVGVQPDPAAGRVA